MREAWGRFWDLSWRWKLAIGFGVFVAIGLLGDALGEDEAEPIQTAATVTEPVEDGAPDETPAVVEAEASVEPTPIPRFDESTIAVRIVSKEDLGGQVEVHFVDERPGVDLYDLALQCVYRELDAGYLGSFCYAFGSQADLEYAEVDSEQGGMIHLCWRARFGIAIAGNTSGAEDNAAYEVSGCPGG